MLRNLVNQVCRSDILRAKSKQRLSIPRLRTISTEVTVTGPDSSVDVKTVTEVDYKESLLANDFFGVRHLTTVEELFQARVHFGHKVGTLNDKMKTFLFGERLGVCIFNLDQTLYLLRQGLNFIAHMTFRGGIVLFVSSDRQSMHMVEKTARDCGEFSHCRRWESGTFTNSTSLFTCQIRLPDVVVMTKTLTSVSQLHPVITEAAKMLIPVVAVVDSNCDPNLITYPIPGNDDSPSAVALYLRLFAEAIKRGKVKREELLKSLA